MGFIEFKAQEKPTHGRRSCKTTEIRSETNARLLHGLLRSLQDEINMQDPSNLDTLHFNL